MYDLISIGSISVDLFFKGDSLTFSDKRFQLASGGKYFVEHFHEGLGGGAANVAIGTQKQGLRSAVVATIGNNDFKHFIQSALRSNCVSDYYCKVKENYYNISSIFLSDDGEKTVINFQNNNHDLFERKCDFEILQRTKSIFIANAIEDKVTILENINNNKILKFVNLGIKDCKRSKDEINQIIKGTDVLLLNGHEFAELVNTDYSSINFQNSGIVAHFPESLITIITDGTKGSYGYGNGEVFVQSASGIHKVVDATGAGDGYTAGFIAEYFKSRDIKKAMEKGTQYAGKILQKIGAN